MTPEQLAQHWNLSLKEVEQISDYINKWYELGVIPVIEKDKTLWQGVMYAWDPRNKYILMESNKKFLTRDEAVFSWTNYIHHHRISEGQAKQMRSGQGVPTDVYLALKPIQKNQCLKNENIKVCHHQRDKSIFQDNQNINE